VGNDSGHSTCSTNYVTCGNGTGPDGSSAGSTVIYTLPASINGYNLTNITVYGGWQDNGRDQQAYTVYYSTVSAPTNFNSLTSVNFEPTVPGSTPSATRVTLTSTTGILATNVAGVKFDFTNPSSENGYCGYAAITVSGTLSAVPPLVGNCALLGGHGGFVISFNGLVTGQSYALQSTTNLVSPVWITQTNFIAAQPSASFTNIGALYGQQYYRMVAQ
jgi:hypothetical protein